MGTSDLWLCLILKGQIFWGSIFFVVFLTGLCLFLLCSKGWMYLQTCRFFLQTSLLYFCAWCLWGQSGCGIGCLGSWRFCCISMNGNRVGETPDSPIPLRETGVGLGTESQSHQPQQWVILGIQAPLLKALDTLQVHPGQLLLQIVTGALRTCFLAVCP